jgi:zinc transport system substrate-binding protein
MNLYKSKNFKYVDLPILIMLNLLKMLKKIILSVLLVLIWISTFAKINVFVSILPEKYFVERVGGDLVTVSTMIKPGASEEIYEPNLKQISALSKADIYYSIDMPFEKPLLKKVRNTNPNLKIYDLTFNLKLHQLADGDDPHVWVDPLLVKTMAATIRDTLTSIDPSGKNSYAKNYQSFIDDLDLLDKYIRQKLNSVKGHVLLVFHPTWGYFADEYHIKQLAIEKEGKEPGPQDLANIIELGKQNKVKAVFVQPQFNKNQAELVAQSLGAKILAIDPLAEDYLINMQKVVELLAANL